MVERISAGALPASVVRHAAVVNGLDASRHHVVFVNTNIVSDLLSVPSAPAPGTAPVLIVVSDPVKMQTDLAVEACARLYRLGSSVRAELIGLVTTPARIMSRFRCQGRLRLNDAADRRTHSDAISRANLLLLPSLAEGAPLAFREAAHFGVPAVINDAGGLRDVVLDRETGRVLPVGSNAVDYARVMAGVLGDPEDNWVTTRSADSRAQRVFTWRVWPQIILEFAGVASATACLGDFGRKPFMILNDGATSH